jgi:hypothetical protein
MTAKDHHILYTDRIKYDPLVKFLLAVPILMLLVLSLLFYLNTRSQAIFPQETMADSRLAAVVLFCSAIFVLIVYWAVMPRELFILRDRIRLRYGLFFWNILFRDIASVAEASGVPWFNINSSITAFGCQVEVVRKTKLNVRICPTDRSRFLSEIQRALNDWKNLNQ